MSAVILVILAAILLGAGALCLLADLETSHRGSCRK